MPRTLLAIVALVLVLGRSMAQGKTVLDVTPTAFTSLTQMSTAGGAATSSQFIVTNTAIQPTGTGVIDPFLTIQQTGQERGYNTDVSPSPLDTKRSGGGFTEAIQLGHIGSVNIGGVDYLQFLLDVNQSGNGPISMNQVQIFKSLADLGSSSPSLTEATQGTGATGVDGNDAIIDFKTSGTEVFRMNNLENDGTSLDKNYEVQIDSGHGSGSGDMFLYVQNSLFGSDPNAYVTLFSQFGHPNGTYESNAGFEEWAYRQNLTPFTVTPEPATVATALSGLIPLGLAGLRRVYRRKTILTA